MNAAIEKLRELIFEINSAKGDFDPIFRAAVREAASSQESWTFGPATQAKAATAEATEKPLPCRWCGAPATPYKTGFRCTTLQSSCSNCFISKTLAEWNAVNASDKPAEKPLTVADLAVPGGTFQIQRPDGTWEDRIVLPGGIVFNQGTSCTSELYMDKSGLNIRNIKRAEPKPDATPYDERSGRVYYQNIVYYVCNCIDKMRSGKELIICGTYQTPSMEVETFMTELVSQVKSDTVTLPRDLVKDVANILDVVAANGYFGEKGSMVAARFRAALVVQAMKGAANEDGKTEKSD